MKLYRIIYEKSYSDSCRYYLFFYSRDDGKAYEKAINLSEKYSLCLIALYGLTGEDKYRINI